MAGTPVLSFTPKLLLNGTAVGFTSCRPELRHVTVNTRDSESGRYAQRDTDEDQLVVSISGLSKFEFNPYAAPLALGTVASVAFVFYPKGNVAPYDTHFYAGVLIVTSFSEDANSQAGSNQTWTLQGESTGAFTLPT